MRCGPTMRWRSVFLQGLGLTILLDSRRRSVMLFGDSAFEQFWALWDDAQCTS